ncbi:nuclear transport factor 2 family protein [Rhodonellum sp.]|uniref:nuclear transport factor 2 family protein n=1 Tax=Rhodonellum sp. TaxID=2231180 RepID=UPI00271CEE57|nr:nuclear transport factor 2 family protein [Rhodonellum sp.]MDO9553587.1 nuclear transport factor 2 family protein [Rhodonellum sp.]
MRRLLGLAFLFLAFSQTQLLAQGDEKAVKEVIVSLFDAMKTKNPEVLGSLFHEKAIMSTVISGDQGAQIGSNSVQDFINRIATTPAETILDERILDYQIKVDGQMAAAWTPYEFYVNDNFSHCGVNSFQLVKTESGWKIAYIIDTRRKEGCD